MVPGVVLEEWKFKDEFSKLVSEFLELAITTRSKDSISSSKENDSPWRELVIETCKISALDMLNQPSIRSKEPSDSVYDTS